MLKKLLLLVTLIFQTSLFAQSWEEHRISNEVDLGKTYGTLLKTEDTKTVVLIIPGSGPTDRNGNNSLAGENNSLKYLAENLANQGIASLRIDKRGINSSDQTSGMLEKITFDVFIMDAINWVNYLKKEKGYKNILILGHSQGSLVSMITAKASKDVKGIISLAGAGSSADELILEQLSKSAPDLEKEARRTFERMKNGERIMETHPMLNSVFNDKTNNFLASWIIFDPADEISRVKVPILIVQGNADLQVGVKEAKKLQYNAKSSVKVELAIIQNMNHVLKVVENQEENLRSYKDPSFPVSKQLMEVLVKWINNN